MVIAVRTERGPDGLEVVKDAADDEDRRRLAREAAVLRRAAQPGVVEIVAASESRLRLRHAGTALSQIGAIAPDHAAAVLRATAEIVDDLHRLGLVHRRIDADHIVISDRGRPRLCGFGDAGEGDEAEQAQDVLALGQLLDRLLDQAGDALWSPTHRGVRAATKRKRAMAAFRTAAAAAQRPEPGQRPTAKQFAIALADALPGLTLPTTEDRDSHGAAGPSIPHHIDPTSDLGWTDDDLSFLALAAREDDRSLDSLASPDDETDGGFVQAPTVPHEDHVDVAPAAADVAGSAEPTVDSPIVPGVPGGPRQDDAVEERSALDEALLAAFAPPPAPRNEGDDSAGLLTAPKPDTPPPAATVAAPAGGPPKVEIRPGPADPAPLPYHDEPIEGSRRRRGPLVALAVVVLALGAVAGSIVARAVDPFGAGTASADESPAVTTVPDDAAPRTPPTQPPGCDSPALAGPDADGDGCLDSIALEGRTATVGNIEIELGDQGDLVVLADSNCDGIATPVLLRPDTGEVFVFEAWALDDPVEVEAALAVPGAASIEASDDPCPTVSVIDDDGVDHVVAPR